MGCSPHLSLLTRPGRTSGVPGVRAGRLDAHVRGEWAQLSTPPHLEGY